jgi:hypothetical protein
MKLSHHDGDPVIADASVHSRARDWRPRAVLVLVALLALAVSAIGSLSFATGTAAAYGFPNSQIADQARAYGIGTWQGQCRVFAGNVVNAVLARNGIGARVGGYGSPGGAYYGAYQNAGGGLVGVNDGQPGDLIQTVNPGQKNSDNPTTTGLHTAIIVARTGTTGTYVVRDSNWTLNETVQEHNFSPAAWAAARVAAVYVWRFGSVGASPEGSFDELSSPPGAVRVRGWAADRDNTGAAIDVHVYIGGPAGTPGAEGHAIGTGVSRPDVQAVLGLGSNHGFDTTIATGKRGAQQVCTYGINIGGGNNSLLGCRTVSIADPNPYGHFDDATGGAGKVVVRGWAADPNDYARAIPVHVYIGGPAGTPGAEGHAIDTGVSRPDVQAVRGIGSNHGFDVAVSTAKRGVQQVCTYAINISFGNNVGLECKSVTITDPPPTPPGQVGGSGTIFGSLTAVGAKLRKRALTLKLRCASGACSGDVRIAVAGRVSRFTSVWFPGEGTQTIRRTISRRDAASLHKKASLRVMYDGHVIGVFRRH